MTQSIASDTTPPPCRAADIRSIKTFQSPDHRISAFQSVSTIGGLIACYAALYLGVAHGFYLVLLLLPLASGLATRSFALQHDCGHGSLFRSGRANRAVGKLCSLLTFTPFDHWRRHHAAHHGDWNNIESRGRLSDIYSDCTTVREYYAMSAGKRLAYRLSKHPVFTLLVMPPVIFFLVYRIPFDTPRSWRIERLGVYTTNLCILFLYGGLAWHFGVTLTALLTLGVIYPAAIIGVALFLVQHKFEGVHWERDEQWSAFEAALTGCSFLRLPGCSNWFSGNIGLHHIHHAAPGIPNYRLAACHDAHGVFHDVKILGLREAFRELFRHTLWDETVCRMIPFSAAHRARPSVPVFSWG
ncbi:fatty acid desaturase [Asaia siamensis]